MLGVGDDLGGVATSKLPQQLFATLKRNKARILDLFRALDVNRDGIITQQEFAMGMAALGLPLTEKDVDYLFDVLDVSDDNQATYEELKALLSMKDLADADHYGMAKVPHTLAAAPNPPDRSAVHSLRSCNRSGPPAIRAGEGAGRERAPRHASCAHAVCHATPLLSDVCRIWTCPINLARTALRADPGLEAARQGSEDGGHRLGRDVRNALRL